MKLFKPLLAAVALSSIAFCADAIVAKRDVRTVTQPDGTTLRVRLVGDEAMHFLMTEDGTLLVENEGVFTYADINDKGQILSTGTLAAEKTPVKALGKTLNIKDVDIEALEVKRNVAQRRAQSYVPYTQTATGKSRAPQTGVGLVSSTYPRTGSPKGLVILVQYSDVKFTHPNPAQYFGDMVNKKGFNEYGAIGSALDYFTEQSGGKFIPSFDVLGPVTLSNKRSYYGGNDSYGDDKNPQTMVTEACRQLDSTVDFKQYDTDGDGLIDNVFVFYAGLGEADGGPAESVWPHSWDVRHAGANVKLDGVTLAHYACSNEWDSHYNRPGGSGTFIHEFSHVMGLPDLYSTGKSMLSCTPGSYSVLDYGPYNNKGLTPPNYGAYERNAMGWSEAIVLDGPITLTLGPVSTNEFALIPTSKNTEFFLLENRQNTGWDAYIPGHGMLIWHIDYNASVFSSNEVNNISSHQYVDIEEANSNANNLNTTAMAGWTFPGTSKKTSFTSSTKPALKNWAGVAINMPITNITEDGIYVTFDAAGGGRSLAAPVPTTPAPAPDEKHFTAQWDAVEGATDYLITVTASDGGPGGNEGCAFDNSELADGWTMSTSPLTTYATATNYGSSAPSLKFSTNGQCLTSSEIPGNISKIEFWAKGQTSSGSTNLLIEGLANGTWTEIATYTPKNLKAENIEITDIPDGVRQVRFTFNKDKGNLAFDDVVITYGGRVMTLPDYNETSTGGKTTYRVDKLAEGYDTYTYTVRATDGKVKSKASEPVTVKVSAMSGVGDIAVDKDDINAPVRYYNLQGVEIKSPAPGTIYIERRGAKARKVIFK